MKTYDKKEVMNLIEYVTKRIESDNECTFRP